MAVKLFLAALLLVGMMWLLGKIRRVAREKRRRAFRTILLYGAAVALLALAITGKLHWLFAVVGAALPWLNRAMTALQAWRFFSGARKTAGGGAPGKNPGAMDAAEAYEVLGLSPGASDSEIIEAHRKLMAKIHPDRGGSDYLAARINRAKEVLLDGRA
ncbi:MAG: DnaJ domain-containing protein [Gammaproteobacteria bacterium]|nr:DnaJ domain-containing protein [Gammaproteobacteria bacterium]